MSSILLVTYDLKTPGKDYTPFFSALKSQGPWWHYLTSTWMLSTTKSAKQIYFELGPYLTTKDYILIVPISNGHWGYLPKEAWEWMRTQGMNIRIG